MIFNMTGGGASLNFQVKTYPSETELKADKPRENTIGVITTTTMTSWVFYATEPTELEVGMVWIALGDSSSIEFNALKNNTLQVYPITAKQYVGGKWEIVPAMIYQDGEWKSFWDGSLYTHNNEWEDFTGGWVSDTKMVNNVANSDGVYPTYVSPTVNKDNDSTTISLNAYNHAGSFHTKNKVNVSKFKTLNIDIVSASSPNSMVLLCLVNSLDDNPFAKAVASSTILGGEKTTFEGTLSLSIESLSGEFYIGLTIMTYANAGATVDFTKIYMEEVV